MGVDGLHSAVNNIIYYLDCTVYPCATKKTVYSMESSQTPTRLSFQGKLEARDIPEGRRTSKVAPDRLEEYELPAKGTEVVLGRT